MSDLTPITNINAPQVEQPDVPEKNLGGRPRKETYQKPVQDTIDMTAPRAAYVLMMHIEYKKGYRNLKPSLQRACEYVIDHAIGKARQKVEHSGGIMTYGELARSADALDKKPRLVLADALEIAHSYQETTPAAEPKQDDKTPEPPKPIC